MAKVEKMNGELENLAQLFKCSVCSNMLTKPTQLQCTHVFCSDCVKTILRSEKADAKCPLCRSKLSRRAVRMRDDIVQLSLAVTYFAETLRAEMHELRDTVYVKDSGERVEEEEEDDENQVIPATPNPKSADSCRSKSTFASPLPSQFNLSMALESQNNDQNASSKKKYVICPSRLRRHELAKIVDLSAVCDETTMEKDYSEDITHLVIKLENNQAPYTMKFFFAIADKKWVVLFDWILECARQGAMVPEEPYECSRFITSPIGGLKARVDHPEKLFDKVNFYFPTELKTSGATLEDCKKLVDKMGGTIVDDPCDISAEEGLIIIGDRIQSKYVDEGNFFKFYKSRGWLYVSWTWVIDCLLPYTIVPITKKHLLTKPESENGNPNLPEV